MNDRPWMPLNIADYLTDTRHLTTLEHGAYLLLIMRYWEDGGLPQNEALIARYAGLTPEQWRDSRDVLAAFFDANWHHKRIDAEIARAADVMEKRRAAGKQRHVQSTEPAHAEQVLSTSRDTYIDKERYSPSLRSGEGARAKRLSESDELSDEMRADATAAGLPPQRHDSEWAKMRDWSLAAKDGARKDWRAAWRNWCRRAAAELPPARGSPPPRKQHLSDFLSANYPAQDDQQTRPPEPVVLNLPARRLG